MDNKDIALESVEDSTQQRNDSMPLHDRKRERRVKLKLDFIVLPLLATVYFLASMGRSDLGNAKISGLDTDLKLTPSQYSHVSSIFLVGHLVLQLPGTLLIRKIGPPLQFGLAMLGWGIVTACTVFVDSYASLMVTRALVGACEAFYQGAVFYLSFWYTYKELATRGAVFYSMSALAGAFNGLIAYAVQKNLAHVSSWSPWQWLFLIEGVVPIGWAFVVWIFLPATPENTKLYFNEDEKALLIERSRQAYNTGESKIIPKLILRVLLDPKFWFLVVVESATLFCLSSLSNFLPAILHSFGWSTVKSQLMTVIVYACGFANILFSARISDKLQKRGIVIIVNLMIGAVGYILLLTLKGASGRFAGACIVAIGMYPNVVIVLTWMATINIGYTYRASAAALINSIAQAVAIGSNEVYNDPPYYKKGHGAALGMAAAGVASCGLLLLLLRYENDKKRKEQFSEKATELRNVSIDEIGNKHPDYFFSY
ncbi:hypothetical protein PV08_02971 [Exophiala spinifera]|uniref:Major facilitator superfamily (MFS) profile domain-containing protein n=1 Tax=Exophiala spinifera TaxID=91928 RepID=A0A0D2A130_9EURO|nr:uncharacterized protein PV08_02971 [Exophiala spinifera]KIW18682.1 hypothetical protein PV08_02971 [Exophiala spinifera]